MIVMTYEGFDLMDIDGQYQSAINGAVLRFDTVYMWKMYIDKLERKQ